MAGVKRRVLGIDPGLAALGWGVVETDGQRHRALGWGALTTSSRMESGERLHILSEGVCKIIEQFYPREGALETLYFAKNVTSALPVAQARGIILLEMYRAGLNPLGEYTPLEIKQALVGNGRAEKAQVQEMVKFFLALPEIPQPDHASDALAAAVAHIHNRSVHYV